MLAGLACGSWQAAVLALCGNAAGTLAAYIAGADRKDIGEGLYGFNGTLVGIAVGVFFRIGVCALLLLAIGAAVSSLLFRWWPMRKTLPPFTAPFIVVTWGLLVFVHWLNPDLFLMSSPLAVQDTIDIPGAFCRHFGQVMFQGTTLWSGILFLAGIMVNSPRHAAVAVMGAVLPLLLFIKMDGDWAEYNTGLLGYNAVLCAMAVDAKGYRDFLWVVVSVILSLVLQVLGMKCGCITLTAPFVIAVWMTMILQRIYRHKTMSQQ